VTGITRLILGLVMRGDGEIISLGDTFSAVSRTQIRFASIKEPKRKKIVSE
jgi:hypothetical protein